MSETSSIDGLVAVGGAERREEAGNSKAGVGVGDETEGLGKYVGATSDRALLNMMEGLEIDDLVDNESGETFCKFVGGQL
jgi:hypothetical protein